MKELLDDYMSEIINMLIKKNQMYGNSFFKTRTEFDHYILVARLIDKVNRLAVLYTNKNSKAQDKIKDTLMDIIGYCLLELVYLETEVKKDEAQ